MDENVTVILQIPVTALLSPICDPQNMKYLFVFIVLLSFWKVISTAGAQSTVTINEADCSRLVTHMSSSDVSYTPGVDVHGNAVVPADLNAQTQIKVPDVISIPVTIDLASNLGVTTRFLARSTVGEVKVSSDGRVTFNGQPINSDAEHELAKSCQEQTRG